VPVPVYLRFAINSQQFAVSVKGYFFSCLETEIPELKILLFSSTTQGLELSSAELERSTGLISKL